MFVPYRWAVVRCPMLPAARAYADACLTSEPPPGVLAAVEIASPTLSREAYRPSTRTARAIRKIQRYVRRMALRTTPFGLFAGVGVIEWSESTDLKLANETPFPRPVLSAELLDHVRRHCECRPEILRELCVKPNPLIRTVGDRLWLEASSIYEPGSFSIKRIPLIDFILKTASSTSPVKVTYAGLAKTFPNLTETRFLAVISTLLEKSFLISSLYPVYASKRADEGLINELSRIPAANSLVASIRKLRRAMCAFERETKPSPKDIEHLRNLAREIAPGLSGDAIKIDGMLAISSRRISREIAGEAARLADLLCRINPTPVRPYWYDQLVSAFIDRYGICRDVPVNTVIRDHTQLIFSNADNSRVTKRDIALMKLAAESLARSKHIVHIDDALIDILSDPASCTPNYPTSCDIAVTVCASDQAAIDRGQFRLLLSPLAGTRQACRMSGRFLSMLGDIDHQKMREVCLSDEQYLQPRGRLRAEIFYSPKRVKMQNVMEHPFGWSHHILLGAAERPEGSEIRVDDLYVGLRNDELALIWAQTGEIVEISALHMLSYSEGSSLVKFLSEIGGWQSGPLGGFDWGLAEMFPRLPRVVSGRTIIRPAQWRLEKWNVADATELFALMKALEVPSDIYVASRDRRLLLNLTNPEHISELITETRRLAPGETLLLHECIPDIGDAWVKGPGGFHFAELTIPLRRRPSPTKTAPTRKSGLRCEESGRTQSLAADWVYIALYTDWHLQDWIIAQGMEILNRLVPRTSQYFYIRYSNPRPHLRVRVLRGARSSDDIASTMANWADQLIENGLCNDHCFLRYEREFERFGGVKAMQLAEAIFCADTRLCVEIVASRNCGPLSVDGIDLCVISLDRLLQAMGLNESDICVWGLDPIEERQRLGTEFRKRKIILRDMLSRADSVPANVRKALDDATNAVKTIWRDYVLLQQEGGLIAELSAIRRSFAHLHVNRSLGIGKETEDTVISLLRKARKSLLMHPQE
ncbi:lantibiotic dehydratase [Luteibacter sp. OK325]|uniref:thiopeptide-type bacteriocin biosynthesis protein n=1 Tax=Luteibacter sp. OK325 TaxID=2135670 RepID=UPI000D3C97D6